MAPAAKGNATAWSRTAECTAAELVADAREALGLNRPARGRRQLLLAGIALVARTRRRA
jgi:hypothetical protein